MYAMICRKFEFKIFMKNNKLRNELSVKIQLYDKLFIYDKTCLAQTCEK